MTSPKQTDIPGVPPRPADAVDEVNLDRAGTPGSSPGSPFDRGPEQPGEYSPAKGGDPVAQDKAGKPELPNPVS